MTRDDFMAEVERVTGEPGACRVDLPAHYARVGAWVISYRKVRCHNQRWCVTLAEGRAAYGVRDTLDNAWADAQAMKGAA